MERERILQSSHGKRSKLSWLSCLFNSGCQFQPLMVVLSFNRFWHVSLHKHTILYIWLCKNTKAMQEYKYAAKAMQEYKFSSIAFSIPFVLFNERLNYLNVNFKWKCLMHVSWIDTLHWFNISPMFLLPFLQEFKIYA